MMIKSLVKNFCNVPLYLGVFFSYLTKKLFYLSFKLHEIFKTEVGVELVKLKKNLKKLDKFEQNTNSEEGRLSDIIKG